MLRCCACCPCTEEQLVHKLPEGLPVAGVTSLEDEVYLLRGKDVDHVEVYNAINYRLLRCLSVPNARSFNDMTSCKHFLCLYIADPGVDCVHRLDLQGKAAQWPVNDEPWGLSVNADHNVIVMCRTVHKIKEFSSRGDILREVTLPDDVHNSLHSIQLTNGQFIVCHGSNRRGAPIHRVCKISKDGCQVLESHGEQGGSSIGQYDVPRHLAVDDNEFVFVVDLGNRRVTLLSPTLEYKRQVVACDQVQGRPERLHLDAQRRRLYVADNEWKDGKFTASRVVVFSV